MYPVGVLFGFGKRPHGKDWRQLTCAKVLTPRRRLRSSRHLRSQRKVQIQRASLLRISSSCLLGPFNTSLRGRAADLHNQFLFTAGMTLLDSVDSILMLYSYTGFAEHRFHLFEPTRENDVPDHWHMTSAYREAAATGVSAAQLPRSRGNHEDETESPPLSGVPPTPGELPEQNRSSQGDKKQAVEMQEADARITEIRKEAQRELLVKRNMMSGLSILLTLMSIVVAFRCEFHGNCYATTRQTTPPVSISLITIMGLIGEKCVTCSAAAENDSGLAGRWWRFWAEVFFFWLSYRTHDADSPQQANDNSGYIGAGIVGSFVLVVGGWYGGRWAYQNWRQ